MIPPKPRPTVELTTRDLQVLLEPAAHAQAEAEVVVAVTVHGHNRQLDRCLESVADQRVNDELPALVLLVDQVGGPAHVELPGSLRERAWVLQANCGSAARARNTVLEFVDERVPACRWVARLDWDDRFASPTSLARAVALGDRADAKFVLGGNRVLNRDGVLLRENPVTASLADPTWVLDRLRAMAEGTAPNELPSCNLLLAARSGFRYPDTSSAEDHWLVADLLLNHARAGALLESPLFVDYTLDGEVTKEARGRDRYVAARRALSNAASQWLATQRLPGRILGLGQEAIVREYDGIVFKHFYPGILTETKVAWLEEALSGLPHIPGPKFRSSSDGEWVATYAWEETRPADKLESAAVGEFLARTLEARLICANVKRSNFRVRSSGELVYIDIGNWIVPMDVSILRDSAARLYSIGVLGNSDDEVLRRAADHSRREIWTRLPGFAEFYGNVIESRTRKQWRAAWPQARQPRVRESEISLLIKACAMDAPYLREQIVHIVSQLRSPRDFAERVLVVDPYEGPFTRAHGQGDLGTVLRVAEELRLAGLLDRVLVAPLDPQTCASINRAWFAATCEASRTAANVPVAPQLWAFDQLRTRFVLQCDVDVLVGRRDREHDYLGDMRAAITPDEVVCVAFNIPHDPRSPARPYAAPAGEYKPEVRCGLLDLQRIRACCPLPNDVADGRLRRTWYQALHECQRRTGRKTVRGGDPATFYVHPLNDRKLDREALGRVRDLVAQGHVPAEQHGAWDLAARDGAWVYPRRSEPVVFVARGRDTSDDRIDRFAASLAMQSDQGFGVVVIDDASSRVRPEALVEPLQFLGDRLTLVRNASHRGRMRNNILAIREVCADPASLIVFLDLDDALADRCVVERLRALATAGHDVILAAPFRPDVPTKIYEPCFADPRSRFGGDVWIHLRAFRKALFDQVPDDHLKLDGEWLQQCDDYATMIPIVELAQRPIYVPEYFCLHERFTKFDAEGARRRDELLERILDKPRLATKPAEQRSMRGATTAPT